MLGDICEIIHARVLSQREDTESPGLCPVEELLRRHAENYSFGRKFRPGACPGNQVITGSENPGRQLGANDAGSFLSGGSSADGSLY